MLARYAERLNALSDRWRSIEERLKTAEQVAESVCIPAINELRYSGRRFFEAWLLASTETIGPAEQERFNEHILMAIQYFNNADHDLTDALISFFDARKRQILDKYGIDKTSGFYERFVAWAEKINDSNDIIKSSRGNRHNRLDDYKLLETQYIPVLVAQYKDIVRSEELYLGKLKKDRWWRRFHTVFAIIGYLIGLTGLLTLWDDWHKLVGLFSSVSTSV